ncbi:methyl-accepting chemotaxis protein [Marinomonas piezotolerans]|uniref:Methyl-accepting chemotaxis protein n=1 Tax=Marinomonas piezotolerans TaxID=2213058 RepID=A0A370UBY7_9GAMM|nr:methyl-accepting chemotaxis protein [Marinomonas piezotolerans]RDL45261.1 methyl-accepting chemotaxis protein [Marinomonas piezotolerans]
MTVRAKIIALVAAGVIIPVLVISLVIINSVRTNAVESFDQQSDSEISHIDALFSMYLDGLAEDAAFFARTDAVKQLSPGSVESYANQKAKQMTPQSNSEQEQRAFSLFNDFGETHPDLAYIWLGTNDEGYLQYPLGKSADNYTPSEKGWYTQAIGAKEPIRIPAYRDTFTGAPLVDYVLRFEGRDGLAGVVGVDVTLKKLTELLAEVKFGSTGYVVMVEDTDTVLADPADPDNNFKDLADASRPYSSLSDDKGVQTLTIDGEPWFATVYTSPKLGWKFIGLVPSSEVYAQANSLVLSIVIIAAIMIALFVMIGSVLAGVVLRPVKEMADRLTDISQGEGDLTQRLEVNSNDEAGQMAQAFNQFVASIDEIVGHSKSSCGQISHVAHQSEELSSDLSGIVSKQANSVDHLSTAFNEMVATANEVASNCSSAANAAETSEGQVQEGNQLIRKTMDSLGQLENELISSNESMTTLSQESKNIVGILDTIKAIAEQTNLLALNAAIEAARAGEQGRGFAVVADEVRTLAGRTADSTDEIDKLLTRLQQQTDIVAGKVENSVSVAHGSVDLASQTYQVFEQILGSVLTIKDMMIQISAAAEEQHLVAEEINNNVLVIHDGSNEANDLSSQVSQTAAALNELSSELQAMVGRFKSSD